MNSNETESQSTTQKDTTQLSAGSKLPLGEDCQSQSEARSSSTLIPEKSIPTLASEPLVLTPLPLVIAGQPNPSELPLLGCTKSLLEMTSAELNHWHSKIRTVRLNHQSFLAHEAKVAETELTDLGLAPVAKTAKNSKIDKAREDLYQ